MTNLVNLLIQNHVAWITLNRPEKLNAMTPEMAKLLVQAVQTCNDSDEVRAVVLSGAGPKAFCASSDIVELDSYARKSLRPRRCYCQRHRGTCPHRGRNGQGQSARGVEHAHGTSHGLRTRPADNLLCNRGRHGGTQGLSGKASGRLSPAIRPPDTDDSPPLASNGGAGTLRMDA